MGFTDQLKKARLDMNYTQQQVADLMGISKSTYCGYETGKRQPDVEKIKQLAHILNTTGDFLLETQRTVDGLNGFQAILADIYGSCEMEGVMGDYGECLYFSLGTGKNRYALEEYDFDRLYTSVKQTIQQMTNLLTKRESTVLNSCKKCANKKPKDGELKKQ